jgi:hypothetical protein
LSGRRGNRTGSAIIATELLAACLFVADLHADAARAAVVQVDRTLPAAPMTGRYVAGPGERSDVSLTATDSGQTPDGDLLAGGAGNGDWISYEPRELPVMVDLADPALGGQRGEDDTLRGIENVHGGSGDTGSAVMRDRTGSTTKAARMCFADEAATTCSAARGQGW